VTVTATELASRVASLTGELQPLQKAAAEAFWELNITGDEHWQTETARLRTEIRMILSRREPYEFLREAVEAANGADPLLRRQALLLRNAHAENQRDRKSVV